TFVEHNVTRCGVDVLDVVLYASTHNGQRIDCVSGVDYAARTIVRNRSQRTVDLQHAISLAVVELNIARSGKNAQRLPGIVGGNQGVNRRRLGCRRGYGLALVANITRDGYVGRRGDGKRGMVLDGRQALTRSG